MIVDSEMRRADLSAHNSYKKQIVTLKEQMEKGNLKQSN